MALAYDATVEEMLAAGLDPRFVKDWTAAYTRASEPGALDRVQANNVPRPSARPSILDAFERRFGPPPDAR